MKRVMVTGAGGMTGSEVSERARAAGWEVCALSHAELDVTDSFAVREVFRQFRPDVAINAAAYTAVDHAESEPDVAAAINTEGPRNVACAAEELRIPIVHISTDYVFDGRARSPYMPEAAPNPLNIYGKTKLGGEDAVRSETEDYVVVRTSWVFSHRGSNFVRSMLRLAAERDELRVVNDQVGRPTAAGDLADALLVVADRLVENRKLQGTYHFANAGETSWFAFAQAIFADDARPRAVAPPQLVPIQTREFPTEAQRPAYSVLDSSSFSSAFGVVPRPWREALHDTLARM